MFRFGYTGNKTQVSVGEYFAVLLRTFNSSEKYIDAGELDHPRDRWHRFLWP